MYSSKTFYLSLLFRIHKIRQYYEKISTSVQVATHTCRQQNSNFHPILGESGLDKFYDCIFFFQPLMLTVDKELSSGKFKLNVFKSDYLSTEFIVYLFRFWKCFINIYFFFTFPTLEIRDLKSRLGQTAKVLGLVSPFNTFYYIHAKVRLRAVSYFSFESPWTDSTEHTWGARGEGRSREERGWFNFFARRAWLWGKKDDRSRHKNKKVLFKARPTELLFYLLS